MSLLASKPLSVTSVMSHLFRLHCVAPECPICGSLLSCIFRRATADLRRNIDCDAQRTIAYLDSTQAQIFGSTEGSSSLQQVLELCCTRVVLWCIVQSTFTISFLSYSYVAVRFPFSSFYDRILISNTEIRRLLLRMTRQWAKDKEEKGKVALDDVGYARLRSLTAPGSRFSFLRCLIPEPTADKSHLVFKGSVADVATAVAKDTAPIAGGVVKNFAQMKPIFECVLFCTSVLYVYAAPFLCTLLSKFMT